MQVELAIDPLLLVVFAFLAVGAVVAGKSDRLRVPASLLFLGIGMVAGDDVLGLVSLDDPVLVQNLGVIALLIILFEGGLTTKPSDLRRAALPGFVLSNVGVLITAAVVAVAVRVLLRTDWVTAALLGAVVSSTDAAAVFSLLKRAPLPRRMGAILEVESGANDPFAIVLTLGLLATLAEAPTAGDWFRFGAAQLLGGLAVGLVGGLLAAAVLRRTRLSSATLYPVLALSFGGLTYATGATIGASGFLAVYIAGLVIGAQVPRHRRAIRSFHASLANTADIGLFLLLGLLVFPSELPAVAVPALAVTAIVLFVARPTAVAVCLTPFGIPWREQTVAAWAGLRGAVPIVLSTFPFTAGYPQGRAIFNVVFFVVLISVLIQGTTVVPLVRRLGLETPRPAWETVAEALPLEGVEADLVEVSVTEELFLAGKTLREAPPPSGMLVTTIVRPDDVVIPDGDTRLLPGDLVVIAVRRHPDAIGRATAWARGELPGREHTPER